MSLDLTICIAGLAVLTAGALCNIMAPPSVLSDLFALGCVIVGLLFVGLSFAVSG